MSITFHLKDVFNLSAIGTYLTKHGNSVMADSCTPASLGNACALGALTMVGGPLFGLSAVFGFAVFASPTITYGIGFAMKELGTVVGRLAPQAH